MVSEDDIYPAEVRQQAALVASKVPQLIYMESLYRLLYLGVLPSWILRRLAAVCTGGGHTLRYLRHPEPVS